MKKLAMSLMAILLIGTIVIGCSSQAPAPAATQAPSKTTDTTASASTTSPAATSQPATKSTYPEKGKTITCIVPWAPGGVTDLLARMLASQMEKDLGTNIEVVNKPGGGSQVGLTELAKAKPDGYTYGTTNLATTNLTYLDPQRQATYNRQSFTPLCNVYSDPDVWGVSSKLGIKTVQEFVEAAKADPKKLRYGSSAQGGDDHMVMLILQNQIGVKFPAVHGDSAVARNGWLLGGNVEWGIGGIGGWMSLIKSGEITPLAVLDKTENKYLPGVKTAQSQGFDLVSGAARGFGMPAGTPTEIVNTLAAAMKKASETPEFQAKLEEFGLTPSFEDPAQFAKTWDEKDEWAKEAMKLLAESQR